MIGVLIYFLCLSLITNILLFFIIRQNKTKNYTSVKYNRPWNPIDD